MDMAEIIRRAQSPAMNLRQPTARWAVWAVWGFALLLLLKAAVPLLATASAELQGKALAEVCTVYGVTTVALDGPDSGTSQGHGAAAHGGDHCTLTALVVLAAPEPQTLAAPVRHRADRARSSHSPQDWRDASATWVARLKHGPPAVA
jgi:hypothetical protein